MYLSGVRTGSKIILTKDFVIPAKNQWVQDTVLPKNLVLSLNSLKVNRWGTTIIFQIIKAKRVREKYYTLFSLPKFSSIHLRRNDAKLFLEEAEYTPFDDEYNTLTH